MEYSIWVKNKLSGSGCLSLRRVSSDRAARVGWCLSEKLRFTSQELFAEGVMAVLKVLEVRAMAVLQTPLEFDSKNDHRLCCF